MKIKKVNRNYTLELTQRELNYIHDALRNSGTEDYNIGDEDIFYDKLGKAKLKLKDQLFPFATDITL